MLIDNKKDGKSFRDGDGFERGEEVGHIDSEEIFFALMAYGQNSHRLAVFDLE